MSKISACFAILLFYGVLISNSHAEIVFYGAATSGGDTLARTADDDYGSRKLKAGGLVHVAAGYDNPLGESAGLRITFGLKYDWLNAENGDATIIRFPLEATVYRRFAERHAFGGGMVYEMAPEFEIDVDGFGSGSVDFDDAMGFVVYYGFSITDQLEAGLRHTFIEYEADGFPALDADNTGIFTSYTFD